MCRVSRLTEAPHFLDQRGYSVGPLAAASEAPCDRVGYGQERFGRRCLVEIRDACARAAGVEFSIQDLLIERDDRVVTFDHEPRDSLVDDVLDDRIEAELARARIRAGGGVVDAGADTELLKLGKDLAAAAGALLHEVDAVLAALAELSECLADTRDLAGQQHGGYEKVAACLALVDVQGAHFFFSRGFVLSGVSSKATVLRLFSCFRVSWDQSPVVV